jgi:hypothetical protein
MEAVTFLEADIAFKMEGNAYRCVKNRFGEYRQGLSKEETEQLVRLYQADGERPLRVFYG